MKVIIDTNVVVSAIFFGGIPRLILRGLIENRISLIITPDILNEYRVVTERLSAKHKANNNELLELVATYADKYPMRLCSRVR